MCVCVYSDKSVEELLLLATGSADSRVYLFNLTAERGHELMQCLEGHQGRVYATDFHPSEALLATASADHSVRLWTPKSNPRSSAFGL